MPSWHRNYKNNYLKNKGSNKNKNYSCKEYKDKEEKQNLNRKCGYRNRN